MKKYNPFFLIFLLTVFSVTVSCPVLSSDREGSVISREEADPIAPVLVEEDESLSTGQRTRWSCLTFGAYPQTEIVEKDFSAVDEYAVQQGDILKDEALYQALTEADWVDDETEIDGTRYLRMTGKDAVTCSVDREQHYRWRNTEEWHYFRYDPIRWRVIEQDGSRVFLMADKLLDCQPFHEEDGAVTWETSTVRSWLNGYSGKQNTAGRDYQGIGFLDKAFSQKEREAILQTQVHNHPNSYYGTDSGSDTEDAVFLLSNEEVFSSDAAAEHGFYAASGKDDPAKRFRSTMYAKCRGSWWSSVPDYRGNSFWFMRTSGYTPESVTYICDFGYIYNRGTISTCDDAGLLVGLWTDLERADVRPAGFVSSSDVIVPAEVSSGEEGSGKENIINPRVLPDENMPDGKQVTYSMVELGEYPQTEITGHEDGAGNSLADEKLYAALSDAEWEEDEIEIDGIRYRKLSCLEEGEERERYFVYEPLLWRVLEVDDGTALLLADKAVDCVPFQEELRDVSWEDCTLRSYLNGYDEEKNASGIDYSGPGMSFLDKAFSEEEKDAILCYPVRNQENYYFGMDSGEDTLDQVFVLAESEIFAHDSALIHGFSPRDEVADRARQFVPTDYALAEGAWQAEGDRASGNVFWMTRTTGYTHGNVVYVDESGYLYNRGILVTCGDISVVPALILDLDSEAYRYAGTSTTGQ